MTSLHNHTRLLVVAALLSILTACGSPPMGPSAAEVRLDMQDTLDARYQGMVQLENFRVVGREIASETRVSIQITSDIGLDESLVADFKSGVSISGGGISETRIFGLSHYREAREAERFYKRYQDQPSKGTLLYRKNGSGMWEVVDILSGHH